MTRKIPHFFAYLLIIIAILAAAWLIWRGSGSSEINPETSSLNSNNVSEETLPTDIINNTNTNAVDSEATVTAPAIIASSSVIDTETAPILIATATTSTLPNTVGLANPASKNCVAQGGTLKIVKRGDGGEFGLCYFEDNRACEEWALMRGDCPIGGRRTTGYDTEAQNYCAWLGGQVFAVENAVCTLPDGRKCLADDLYNGQACGTVKK